MAIEVEEVAAATEAVAMEAAEATAAEVAMAAVVATALEVVVLPQEVASDRCQSIPTSVEASAAVASVAVVASIRAEVTRWASLEVDCKLLTGIR